MGIKFPFPSKILNDNHDNDNHDNDNHDNDNHDTCWGKLCLTQNIKLPLFKCAQTSIRP